MLLILFKHLLLQLKTQLLLFIDRLPVFHPTLPDDDCSENSDRKEHYPYYYNDYSHISHTFILNLCDSFCLVMTFAITSCARAEG